MTYSEPSPRRGVGSAAAEAASRAAVIIASVARETGGSWSGARGAASQAMTLAERLATLSNVDAQVFTAALDALEQGSPDLKRHLEEAAAVPVEIAEKAADVAEAGLHVAERCDGLLRADAAGAAALAAGAALAAANLVRVNLALPPDDNRIRRAFAAAEDARYAALQALDAGP
jgi:formiminotetrahydrofolate cyclodeaminase